MKLIIVSNFSFCSKVLIRYTSFIEIFVLDDFSCMLQICCILDTFDASAAGTFENIVAKREIAQFDRDVFEDICCRFVM